VQNQVPLQALNTLAIPARAAHFCMVRNLDELKVALDYAVSNQLSILPLGGGSNLVFEHDYTGLVIHNQLRGSKIIEENSDGLILEVAAGESWSQLVEDCTRRGWHGLENLALIPGTVGAAPIQNIGAYGVELADIFVSLDYIDIRQHRSQPGLLQPLSLNKADCAFAYRDSIFKHSLSNLSFITGVRLKLSKDPQNRVHYPALSDYLTSHHLSDTPENIFSAVCSIRKAKLPNPAYIPNAGSFFKNPLISEDRFKQLKQRYPGIIGYPAGNQTIKVAAGWLIEQAGWKGKTRNGVGMHEKQALVLINPGKQPGEAVLNIAHQVIKDVWGQFQIQLEIEPRGERGQILS